MLKISKTSKYALKGVLYLLKNRKFAPGFVKISEISRKENIPLNYLRKIFQKLITNKIVISGVGPNGGVKLSDHLNEISIAKIIAIFDGEPEENECSLFGTKGCPTIKACPIHDECFQVGRNVWVKLNNFKIENFIK